MITRFLEGRHPPKGERIPCDGVRVHYVEEGNPNGQTVVYLHGLTGMIQDFTSSGVVELLERDYRILCFDRPGYGYTERPDDRAWTPEEQAELFVIALQQLRVESCIVVAHSWGTAVAIALALRAPQLVKGLVLLAGYYFPRPHRLADIAAFGALPIVSKLAPYGPVQLLAGLGGARFGVRLAFAPGEPTERFEAEFPLGLVLRPISVQATADEAALFHPSAERLQNEYARLRCPVVLMVGDGDQVTYPEQSIEMNARFPGMPLDRFPEGGHLLHHARPQEVADRVKAVAAGQVPPP